MNSYYFTTDVRDVLTNARVEAEQLQHEHVGTEHVLLSILSVGDNVALKVLQALSVDTAAMRHKVRDLVKKGNASARPGREVPYTSRAKKVLELAMTEARDLGHQYVGTEHLLLGLIREERGVAAQVLVDNGVTVDVARPEVLRHLDAAPPTTPVRIEPNRPMKSPYAPQNVSPNERILARLRSAEATSPASARSLEDLRCKADDTWRSLVDEGRIREGAPGTFYLYERATTGARPLVRTPARFIKTFVFWLIILLLPIILIQFASK
jgi:ATP-dependent Clp protease ATP-binding subunit ClpA